jgi:hypothetical protein
VVEESVFVGTSANGATGKSCINVGTRGISENGGNGERRQLHLNGFSAN